MIGYLGDGHNWVIGQHKESTADALIANVSQSTSYVTAVNYSNTSWTPFIKEDPLPTL